MVSVRKAVAEDYSAVLPLLRRLSTEHDWAPLFRKAWSSGEETFGYLLEDQGKVVGFLGLIHSERLINGQPISFCHTSSWIVEESYRKHSLGLLAPVIKMNDRQVVDLSASKDVHNISLKLGFTSLDTAFVIIPALPVGRGILKWTHTKVINGVDAIEPLLGKEEQRILRDHHQTPCQHLLLKSREATCYIIGTRVIKRGLPFFRIHYFSNVVLFLERAGSFRTRLGMATASIALITDKRFLRGQELPLSKERALPYQRMVKGSFLQPEDIDNLYSEYAIMEMQ